MKQSFKRAARGTMASRRRGLAGVAAIAVCSGLAVAAQASAKPVVDENYKPFVNCPIGVKKLEACIVATTTSGEFKLGSKTVKIETPVLLQGGLLPPPKNTPEIDRELIPPTNGAPVLVAAPMKVPGGLTGIEGVGEEVTASTELVGPVIINESNQVEEKGIAVKLPIRVKLNNGLLGEECLVGSAAEPITLNLTTGATSPPAPNKSIHGSKGTLSVNDNIATFSGLSLVDNSFAAPGAKGCGGLLELVENELVDTVAGLPSAAGSNTAILNGTVQEGFTKEVKKSHVIPKAKK
jgi:hypothetical protein